MVDSVVALEGLFIPPADCKRREKEVDSGAIEPLVAAVCENTRLTKNDWTQNVRHIALDVSHLKLDASSSLLHKAGDIATVYPTASRALVDRMLAIVGLPPDTALEAKLRNGECTRKSRITTIGPCKLDTLLSRVVDISGLPQRSFFEGLARFASNMEEREKLLEISSAAGTDLYFDYCIREKRNYVEVLEDFRSARPSLEYLLELLPVMRPRHYSIASSGIANPNEVSRSYYYHHLLVKMYVNTADGDINSYSK
jgi:sulfite reductase alpha subunit-like flavoprotein